MAQIDCTRGHFQRSFRVALTTGVAALGAIGSLTAQAQVLEQLRSADSRIATAGTKEAWTGTQQAPANAPNVVIILLDDVGYGAASTFGGPIPTPGMDQLASEGLRYNNFRVTALCSPTRAALLTGRNDHRVSFGTVSESLSPNPGYKGVWPKEAASVARVLQLNGYKTAAFGKWHNTPYFEVNPTGPFDRWPTRLGFDYFYGFMAGAMDHFNPALYRNTTPVEQPRSVAQGYHLSADLTDNALGWLESHYATAPDKPYLLYYAPGAAHEPHQPPRDWIEKYRGQFDQGWDKLRAEIFQRQKRLGFVPADAKLTPRPDELPAWQKLSADQQAVYARQMEVYAAFLAYTDEQVARLVRAIRARPDGANTAIFYVVSDNGASAEGGPDGRDIAGDGRASASMAERTQRLDELGDPSHAAQYSAGWAWATSSPFQWTKQVASHLGGTSSPLIVSWPKGIADKGGLRQQFSHVNSIAPTIYEMVGITPPAEVEGVKQMPFDGVSFAYTFNQPKAPSRHHTQVFEQMGNRAIYHDGWWAGALHSIPWNYQRSEDFSKDKWELYHLETDFSQSRDLAKRYPKKLAELQALFDTEAKANNIYPLNNSFGRNGFGGEQPRLVDSRSEFVFGPRMDRLPSSQGPDFSRSHRIEATVEVPAGGSEGTLIANGGNQGGFLFYVKNGHAVYEINYHGGRHRQTIRSAAPLPAGKVTVAYEYHVPAAGQKAGTATLSVTGQEAVTAAMPWFEPPTFTSEYDMLTVGRTSQARIGETVVGPFPFTGTIDEVRITLLK